MDRKYTPAQLAEMKRKKEQMDRNHRPLTNPQTGRTNSSSPNNYYQNVPQSNNHYYDNDGWGKSSGDNGSSRSSDYDSSGYDSGSSSDSGGSGSCD